MLSTARCGLANKKVPSEASETARVFAFGFVFFSFWALDALERLEELAWQEKKESSSRAAAESEIPRRTAEASSSAL